MHRRRELTLSATLASMALVSSKAFAVEVVVAFDGADAIPLPLWLIPVLAGLLALLAYKPLRTYAKHGKVRSWLLVSVLATVPMAATISAVREARASAQQDVLELFTSPARFVVPPIEIHNMIQSGSGYGFAVQNKTGQTVQIAGRHFEQNPNGMLGFYFPAAPVPTPECTQELALAPGDTCYIFMHSKVHW